MKPLFNFTHFRFAELNDSSIPGIKTGGGEETKLLIGVQEGPHMLVDESIQQLSSLEGNYYLLH